MEKELERVKYKNSPLVEVVFQLRFPTILSINTNPPVEFQENIRENYPLFEEQLEEAGDVIVNPQLRVASLRKTGEHKNYAFISADNKIKINLTPSFIAISTMAYTQWEDYRKHIDFVVPIFEAVYHPAFYTRVGLRYIDVITRSVFDLQDRNWIELIKPHILGMVTEEHEAGVKTYLSEIEYETKEDRVLSKAHFEFVHVNDQAELSLLIDCDYYSVGMTKIEEMNNVAEKLHNASSQFIQTAITEKLHQAMQPIPVETE